jgi:flagellar biosynthesis/type III secretory pathway M-ring protein FliF/YscJ
MYLTAIAWTYVVLMMSAAELASPQGTVLGALSTLVFYGLVPLGIVLYIMGTPARRRLRRAREAQASAQTGPQARDNQRSDQPDASGHATAADAVSAQAASVREKR